ncbi:MAG TPA: DUF998 domain-containing protein [Chloroflexota bacterium]|nr:DUF998 domain-containing protein [Chloroflexota bacterium]
MAAATLGTRPRVYVPAARLSVGLAAATLALLGGLHVLSPEFDPSWRMVSEYALGHHAFVLSLVFTVWGLSTWALAAAIWRQVDTRAGRVGLWLLVIAGVGEAMAAVFDITHDVGHTVAGLLGMTGLPIGAVLISLSLNHKAGWAGRRPRMATAYLTCLSVPLLIATTVLMAVQFARINGGVLPDHAPAILPAGVLGLDGWADRFLVVSYCLWQIITSLYALKVAPHGESAAPFVDA